MTAARVRVVTVNHDGGHLTLDCLTALRATAWPSDRLEIVLVDNASSDGVAAEVRRRWPDIRVLESPRNLGFTGGCNLGLRDRGTTDYVALLNNDATVDPDWLEPLVSVLHHDPSLGAACPKIRFAGRYVDVEVRSPTGRRGPLDGRRVGVRLAGARVDDTDVWPRLQRVEGTWGLERGRGAEREYAWTQDRSLVRMPADGGPIRASLRLAAPRPRTVTLRSGTATRVVSVLREPTWFDVPVAGPAIEVINNVGSQIVADGYGADRGYLEPDRGQYEHAEDVFAWCGAAVLLSREYLDDVGVFDERLFLYYEDLELSWRGQDRGWRYRYVPTSTVAHVHAASSGEGSIRKDYFNERNHLLVVLRHARLGVIARAFMRFLGVTASYAQRDLVAPLVRLDHPDASSVTLRVRALLGALRLAPSMLAARRRDGRVTRRRAPMVGVT